MAKTGRRAAWLALAAMAGAAAAGVWLIWPRPAAAPQARQYLNVSACLLTDQSGIVAGAPGAPAWKAMESASLATHVMVTYLPDTGSSDVTPMLNTLIQRQCGVIITTGTPPSQVIAAARANPRQHFLLITAGTTAAAPANTVVVSPATAAGRIDQAIHALAAQA